MIKDLTIDISPFDNITISPVHTLAALRKSLLKISRRAARDIFSEPSFSSAVNVLDCNEAIYPTVGRLYGEEAKEARTRSYIKLCKAHVCSIESKGVVFTKGPSPEKVNQQQQYTNILPEANDNEEAALASYAAELVFDSAGLCDRTI